MASEAARVATRCMEAQEHLALDLADCGLTSMPLGMFTMLADTPLVSADFSRNSLKKVHSKMNNFSTLKTLTLASNQLTDLPSALSALPLTSLDLSGNNLTEIPEVVFSIRSLVSLDLGNNQIATVDPKKFSSLGNLTELRMAGNQVDDALVNSILVQLQFPAVHRRF